MYKWMETTNDTLNGAGLEFRWNSYSEVWKDSNDCDIYLSIYLFTYLFIYLSIYLLLIIFYYRFKKENKSVKSPELTS